VPLRRRELALFIVAFALLAGATVFAWRAFGRPPTGVDDADIFLTYARHWLAGDGLVFSAGGERVEGFSSPLWLAICALALALTPTPELALRVISVGLAAAAVTAVTTYAVSDLGVAAGRRGIAGRALRGVLALAWSITAPAYCVWTGLSLLDTALHSACVCLGAIAAARAARRAGDDSEIPRLPIAVCVAVAALLLARSEGIAEGLGLVVVLFSAVALRRRSAAAGWRVARFPLATFAATLALILSARLAYFGFPFPNTYYAKVSPDLGYTLSEGAFYLLQFGFASPLAALAFGAALALSALGVAWLPSYARSRAELGGLTAIGGVTAIAYAVPIAVGGDHFSLFRIAQPAWPLLILPLLALFGPESVLFASAPSQPIAIQASLTRESRRPLWAAGGAASAGAIFAMFAAQTPIWPELGDLSRFKNEFSLAVSGRFLGERLNQIQSGIPPLRVGVLVCGGFGYAYRGPVADLLGLNLVAMAHAPGDRRGLKNHAAFDAEVLFADAPELLFPDGTQERDPRPLAAMLRPASFENRVTRGLLDNERFRARYVPALFAGPGDPPSAVQVTGFARRDLVADLRARGLEVRVFEYEELSGLPLGDWR
jgi:hypothetical protein